MKPKTLFPLAGLPEFDEISAVETEADGLACNYISPSQIHARHACYHELLAVMDFIFHVDLSTAYVVLRRDFVTSQDPQGSQSSPVGAGFYYSAEAANEAARAHCSKEAAKNRSFMSERVVHFEKNGLYMGGCVMRAEDRHRFEVKVKRLRARGSWGGRRNGILKAVEEEGEREVEGERSETPMSASSRSTVRTISRLWSRIRRNEYGTV